MKHLNSIIFSTCAGYLFTICPRLRRRPKPMPKVFYAHRGFHHNASSAPENTLAAFAAAVEHGYGIELDLQLSKDGQVVVAHDFDLHRICGIDKQVDAFTWTELQDFPIYNSDQRIPLFQDVLKLVDGKVPLIVEMKYKDGSSLCEKAQELLDQYKGIYCIESFHPQALYWYKKNAPHVCRGQLSMNFLREERDYKLTRLLGRHLMANFITRPDFIAYDHRAKRAVSKNICRRIFRCPSFAWTVKSQAELDQCRHYYDYFIFEGFHPH